MTVREMIAALRQFDENLEVHMAYNYGDHWRTTVAPAIEEIEEGAVRHSAYHSMDKLVDEDEDEKKDNDRTVVVLR